MLDAVALTHHWAAALVPCGQVGIDTRGGDVTLGVADQVLNNPLRRRIAGGQKSGENP